MEGKARYIFPVFVPRWLKAFATGWPVAAVLAFVAVPHVRRATCDRANDRRAGLKPHCTSLIPSVSPICFTVAR